MLRTRGRLVASGDPPEQKNQGLGFALADSTVDGQSILPRCRVLAEGYPICGKGLSEESLSHGLGVTLA